MVRVVEDNTQAVQAAADEMADRVVEALNVQNQQG